MDQNEELLFVGAIFSNDLPRNWPIHGDKKHKAQKTDRAFTEQDIEFKDEKSF